MSHYLAFFAASLLLLLVFTEVTGTPVHGESDHDDEYQTQLNRVLSGQCPVVDCQVFEEILQCPYSERVGTYFTNDGVECLGCRKCSDEWTKQHTEPEEEDSEPSSEVSRKEWTKQHIGQDGVREPQEEDSGTSGELPGSEGTEDSREPKEEESDEFMKQAKDILFKEADQEHKSAILVEGSSRIVQDLLQFLKNAVGSKLSMRVLA